VDDHEMGVTHVLRGEDHISNTPRQILIQEAIGAKRPVYGHLPLIFDAEHKKLSKRKHGEIVWIDSYKKQGYLPDALLNFFALMGWNPGTEEEIFKLDKLVEAFDIDRVQKGAAVFNLEKLKWINKEHMKMDKEIAMNSIEQMLKEKFGKHNIDPKIVELVFERINVLSDIDQLIGEGELDYFFESPEIDKDKLVWKKSTAEQTFVHMQKALEIINSGDDLMKYAEEVGKGDVLWPVRFALSGKEKSPDPFTLLDVLGKEESIKRIKHALELLK
jgi:glutamyl/glutaminyl-tRNA synthetase